jgi:4-amino-4-deoxy-L-arabinose transferase-like glycosyltransferase
MNFLNKSKSLMGGWDLIIKRPRLIWFLSGLWLLALAWFGFLGHLGNVEIMDKTEAIYTEVARQIVETRDWITPRWNQENFFDYPIGGYWLVALSMTVLGNNPWAARLPSALMAIALVVMGFYTLRYFGATHRAEAPSQKQLWIGAWIGAGILAMNPGWVAWGRTAGTDIFLSSGVSLAILAFFVGYAQPENSQGQQCWYRVFPIFLAIAVLAKGPIGIVIPFLSIGSFLLYLGKMREVWREIRPLRTLFIFLLIAAPWYIASAWVNGASFLGAFFGKSNFQRAISVIYGHSGPVYYYLPWLLIFLLPWSIYLLPAIFRLKFWQRAAWRAAPRAHHLGILAFFWLIIPFLFFSAVFTKLPGYILPVIPAGALLVTLFWSERMNSPTERLSWGFWTSAILNLLVLLALAIAGFISPQLVGEDPMIPHFRPALQASGLPLRTGIIWGIATIAGLFLLMRPRRARWLWLPNLWGFIGFLSLVGWPASQLMDTYRQLPLRQLSSTVMHSRKPQEELFVLGFIRPSVVYYSQHPVKFFYDIPVAVTYLRETSLNSHSAATVLVMLENRFMPKLNLSAQDYQDFGVKGGYRLIRVNKQVFLKLDDKNSP